MSKTNHNIPSSILSFVKKKSTITDDEDSAFLLPSYGSSFNLTGDSEDLLTKSTSHQSNNSGRSSKSSASRAAGASTSSGGSSGGGSGHHHHHHHKQHKHHKHHRHDRHRHSISHGGDGGEIKKKKKTPQQQQQRPHELDSSHPLFNRTQSSSSTAFANRLGELAFSNAGIGGGGSSGNNSPTKSHRSDQDSLDFALRKTLPMGAVAKQQDQDRYLVGCNSDDTNRLAAALSPIAGSYHSERSATTSGTGRTGDNRLSAQGGTSDSFEFLKQEGAGGRTTSRSNNSFEMDRSAQSNRSTRSGTSSRSRKSTAHSSRSSAVRRRGKLKREEKRRKWIQRWKRRHLLGKMILNSIYSILVAYTLLVTLGPLALYFGDPVDWCPLYNGGKNWDARYYNHFHYYEDADGYSLNIDQLQQSGQQQREGGDEHRQRRSLVSERNSFSDATPKDLKGVEIDLLRKTSKDIHSNNDVGTNNNNAQPVGGGDNASEQPEGTATKPTTTTASNHDDEPKYENPDYDDRPCHNTARIPSLFYLTLEECDLSRRMAASVLFGGFIGYERRAADRPAGIRTMALVALGSCFFTISSQQAFRDSPMTWDASRVTAAIPSGVGFLGAGLIWKGSLSDGKGGEVHQVHGITTAASLWLAAAVGVGAGGALYAVSAYSTALIILVLRFGPRLYLQNDKGFEEDEEEEYEEECESDVDGKYDTAPQDKVLGQTADEKSGISRRQNNYEMHQMSPSTNDTTTLNKNEATKYGATDVEQHSTVAALLLEDHRRKVEKMNRLAADNSSAGSEFVSWLINLLPGRGGRQQPTNPYQGDREVMRMLKRKKSTTNMTKRPSFCT